MDHRLTSLKFLSATGLIPVKVRPKQKDPFPEWDPRRAALENHDLTLKELQARTDLNIGALFYGKYVDLDDDANNPTLRAALDYFLPPTPFVYGRKGKPKSHRIYTLHDDFDREPHARTLRFIKSLRGPDLLKGEVHGAIDERSYSIELRGGKPENGLFSVLPGSIHPSGEAIEWANGVDPTVGGSYITLSKLVRGLRLAICTAMIAPYWQEGTRNDLSLALSGVLWRIRTSSMAALGLEAEDETPEDQYVLDETDAEAVLKAVMLFGGDDTNDERSRLLNFKNTWRKLSGEGTAKVTGGKVLADLIGPEVGSRIVKALYRLLSDNDSAEQLEALAERYVMWYGPGVIIDLNMIEQARDTPWMSRAQAEASLGGKNLTIAGKKIPIAKLLFGSPIIRRVIGLTFDPGQNELVVPTNTGLRVNQWRGFHIKPCEQQVSNSEIKMFYDYVMEVIADGDPDKAHWVFAWCADMLQNPHKKPGTALVLVGVEGAGKTFLGEHVLGKIIGPVHASQTNSVHTLTHNFNTIVDNKVFVWCDEATHSGARDTAARLKSIITDETIIIEPKGINAYVKPNHMHFLFTSNEEHSAMFINSSPYERRFTVIKTTTRHAGNSSGVKKYWEEMRAWTPAALPKIMRWLLDYRYDRWLIMRPLDTQAKRNIQRVGLEMEVAWMLSRISDGFPLNGNNHHYWWQAFDHEQITDADKKNNTLRRDHWPTQVVTTAIEDDYRAFTRSMGKQVYSGSLITSIKKVLPNLALTMAKQQTIRYVDIKTHQIIQARVRFYTWPSKEEIIAHLREKYGEVIDNELENRQQEEAPVAHDKEEY